jgi:hypothetical protein
MATNGFGIIHELSKMEQSLRIDLGLLRQRISVVYYIAERDSAISVSDRADMVRFLDDSLKIIGKLTGD